MRLTKIASVLGSCLLFVGPAWAQTGEIQKQVEKKLESMRLDEVMAQALKGNPDIRVAEAKLREAEAELYRVRVTVLNRVVILRNEIRSAQATAEEATSRYQRQKELVAKGAASAPELSTARAAAEKFKADLAVKEAELDLLIGKHQGKLGEPIRNSGSDKPRPPPTVPPGSGPPASDTAPAVSDAMREKVFKALDGASYSSGPKELVMTGSELLDLLRKHTKGINILSRIGNGNEEVRLHFKEAIPLAALFQWAEDQLGWRFIVRDYGIVAVEPSAVPPGAVLLRDVWPARPEPAA